MNLVCSLSTLDIRYIFHRDVIFCFCKIVQYVKSRTDISKIQLNVEKDIGTYVK